MIKHKYNLIIGGGILLLTLISFMIVLANIDNDKNIEKIDYTYTDESSYFYRLACLYGGDGQPSFQELFSSYESLQKLKK